MVQWSPRCFRRSMVSFCRLRPFVSPTYNSLLHSASNLRTNTFVHVKFHSWISSRDLYTRWEYPYLSLTFLNSDPRVLSSQIQTELKRQCILLVWPQTFDVTREERWLLQNPFHQLVKPILTVGCSTPSVVGSVYRSVFYDSWLLESSSRIANGGCKQFVQYVDEFMVEHLDLLNSIPICLSAGDWIKLWDSGRMHGLSFSFEIQTSTVLTVLSLLHHDERPIIYVLKIFEIQTSKFKKNPKQSGKARMCRSVKLFIIKKKIASSWLGLKFEYKRF